MDPLSLTASLLAVIGAAKAGIKGIRQISNYRKAPQEVTDLLSELQRFQQLLTDIKSFTDLCPDTLFNEGLYQCVQSSASKISAINALVASDPFKSSRLSDDIRARVVWTRYKQILLSMRHDLQVLRMDLVVRIGLIKTPAFCRLEESLGVSIRAQNEISDQLSKIVEMMTPNRSPHCWPSRPPRLNSNFGQVPTGIITVSDQFKSSTNFSNSNLCQQVNIVQYSSPVAMKQRCTASCSCRCHVRNIIQSPWAIEAIVGKISVQYALTRPECNEFYCRRSSGSSIKIVYKFPEYMMSRYISMFMQFASSGGPEFILRTPRMVSWSQLLWYYAQNGDVSAIQKLYTEGKACPHDIDPHGANALYYAVTRRHSRLVQFLLDQGVDADHPNDVGSTPNDVLWSQFFAGEVDGEGHSVLGNTFQDTDHIQAQNFSILHKIILGIVDKDLEFELETSTAAIDVGDAKNRTPLCWASIRNNLQAVKTLLGFGANPNLADLWGHTPLVFSRSIDICKLLLDAGVNIHASSRNYRRSALHQIFKITIEMGKDSVNSETLEKISLLVDAGMDVNVRDIDGETPLLNAIFSGHSSHARRLLELGADPNACNLSSRKSAIHFAVSFNRYDLILMLLEHGANYTATNAYGDNIAHMAARSAGTKTISVLAESNLANLDVSLRNQDGKTPADILSARSILTDSERGLHAEFERFVQSVAISIPSTITGVSRAAVWHERIDPGDDEHHLRVPGAYPILADSKFSV